MESRSGKFARTVERSTALNLDDVESEFRAGIGAILDRALTLDDDQPVGRRWAPGFATGPQRDLLAEAGLAAPHLPAPLGLGANALQQVIVSEEFAKRPGLIRPRSVSRNGCSDHPRHRVGASTRAIHVADPAGPPAMVPAVQRAGRRIRPRITDHPRQQGRRRLDRQRAQDLDLAGPPGPLRGAAGTHRTGRAETSRLSYFLVDMTSPASRSRPIKQASGHAEFNEVFFTDVFVPDDMMVGEPGGGWSLAVGAMAVERTAIGNYVSIDRADALRRMAEVEGPEQDAALRTLGDVEAYTTAIKAMVLRETLRLVEGQAPGTDIEHRQVRDGHAASPRTHRHAGLTSRIAMLEESGPGRVPALLRCLPNSSAAARRRSNSRSSHR